MSFNSFIFVFVLMITLNIVVINTFHISYNNDNKMIRQNKLHNLKLLQYDHNNDKRNRNKRNSKTNLPLQPNVIKQDMKYTTLGARLKKVSTASVDVSHVDYLEDISNLLLTKEECDNNNNNNNLNNNNSDDEDIRLADTLSPKDFGAIFRQCAPYIAMHGGSTLVIHLPSFILFGSQERFDAVMDDFSLLNLLGVRLVIVIGVKEHLDKRLAAINQSSIFEEGIRITDESAMQQLKEVSGAARFEVESALARGFRGRHNTVGINVVSGNFFYSAKPIGVRNGIDYRYSGEVRRIDNDQIKQRLDTGDLVLLTSLGYSTSGEVFNVNSETLAANCAASMQAEKIIYLVEGDSALVDNRAKKPIQSLRVNEAVALLDRWGIKRDHYVDGESEFPNCFSRFIARSVHALLGGVKRAHLIPPTPGTLLKELYTRDGSGLLVSRDVYEGIRKASPSDLRSIEELIRPLEQDGILTPRSREKLEDDLEHTHLLIRDGQCLACGMIKKYGENQAEVACLAVHPAYRRSGRGETMLSYLEREGLRMGISEIFVLSTRTMQWFEERGFMSRSPTVLPEERGYDTKRNSKVYVKKLGGSRDVDEEEVLWDLSS